MGRNTTTLLSLIAAATLGAAACVPPGTAPTTPSNSNSSPANSNRASTANANTANGNTTATVALPGQQTQAARADEHVSARSDSVTGGRIERAELQRNNPDLRITMNAPAYQLTLWQAGKEVKTWPIAIGLEKWPLPSGSRTAERMIINPEWVPPNSDWVEDVKDVKPGERVPPGDKRNPIGEIKIPLGDDGTLIHEAKSRAELGKPVSHGCARMVRNDLVELTEMIAAAQGLPLTREEILATIKTDETREIKLERPVPVDIAYDTAVVEGGKLHVYADVYKANSATPTAPVREELTTAGVDAGAVDDKALQTMVARAKGSAAFVVPVEELKAGRGLAAGKTVPLGSSGAGDGKSDKNVKGGGQSKGRR